MEISQQLLISIRDNDDINEERRNSSLKIGYLFRLLYEVLLSILLKQRTGLIC